SGHLLPKGRRAACGALALIVGSRCAPLSPSGRGREAMTYGRELLANPGRALDGAVVGHSAELVRGDLLHFLGRPPESAPARGWRSAGGADGVLRAERRFCQRVRRCPP